MDPHVPSGGPPDPGDSGPSGGGPSAGGRSGGGPSGDGPSDPGLAGERTSLAWARIGLTLVGIPSGVMAYSAGHEWVAFTASLGAAVLGLATLSLALRRQRAGAGMIARGSLPTASEQVIVTATAVLLLAVASLGLVLL